MSKAAHVTDRFFIWDGNRLEVSNLYVVTFEKGFNRTAVPAANLNTWLNRIERVILARIEFIHQLSQMKEKGICHTDMQTYRFSSRLYNQICKIKNLPHIESVHLTNEIVKKDTTIELMTPDLKGRVEYVLESGTAFLAKDELDETAQAEIERCWVAIKQVVEKTLKELDTLAIYEKPEPDKSISEFTEFNETINKANGVFTDFKVVAIRH